MQKSFTQNIDRVFEKEFEKVKAFAFDEQVANVFSDMIQRSVPGYDTILRSIAMFCMKYAQNGSYIYDLGCSLGAVAITAAEATQDRNCQIVGIDTSDAMIERCRQIVQERGLSQRVQIYKDDITVFPLKNASVIVSNFTIQFIPQKQRQKIIENIFEGLNPDGVFILSEKIKPSHDVDEFLTNHYHAYKKLNGYSNLEIQRKRQALRDVLIPDTVEEIENRLKSAGFKKTIKWFQCFGFVSFIAIK